MKRKSEKPICPRKPLARLKAMEGVSPLSADQRRVVEEVAQEQDREFAAMFSHDAMTRTYDGVRDRITKAGWLGACPTRNGVKLASLEGFAADRASAAALDALEHFAKLDAIIMTASPKELRSLRIAFQAGAGWAECRAHKERSESGRKSLKTTMDAEIEDAVKKWKAAHPQMKREPSAREAYGKFTMKTDRNKPGPGRFNTIYSEWRRSRKLFP